MNIFKSKNLTFMLITIIIIIIPKIEYANIVADSFIASQNEIKLGDANEDGIINIGDIITILRHRSATIKNTNREWLLKEKKFKAADVTEDNKIDAGDILVIQRYIYANKNSKIAKANPEWLKIEHKKSQSQPVDTTKNVLNSKEMYIEDKKTERVEDTTNLEEEKEKENEKEAIIPNLKLSVENVTLYINGIDSTKLIVTGNDLGNITYSSSNNKVAYIENGYVKAKGNGNCIITATDSNSNVKSSLTITVKTLASGIKLNKSNVSLDIVNDNIILSATVSPSTASTGGVNWSSSNTKVVKVDSSGKVTRVGEGTAIITATAKDKSGKKDSCNVIVKKEKLIICGASTVEQMAGRRTISEKNTAYANIAYYATYGYHIRTTENWLKNYYSYLKNYGTNDLNSDLFFVCKSGAGYKWLSGNNPSGKYWTNTGASGNGNLGNGKDRITRIVTNNKNCHFTIGIMLGGNDVSYSSITDNQIKNVAKQYANYYKEIDFTDSVYAITPTPKTNKVATNRKKFITALKSELKGSKVKVIDLFSTFTNNKNFKTIDGSHYDKETTRLVLKTILNNMNVLDINGKKK